MATCFSSAARVNSTDDCRAVLRQGIAGRTTEGLGTTPRTVEKIIEETLPAPAARTGVFGLQPTLRDRRPPHEVM